MLFRFDHFEKKNRTILNAPATMKSKLITFYRGLLNALQRKMILSRTIPVSTKNRRILCNYCLKTKESNPKHFCCVKEKMATCLKGTVKSIKKSKK